MFARSLRRLAGVVTASSVLAGCAHQYPGPTAEDGYSRAAIEEPNKRLLGPSEFCAQHEWVCIIAGLAAFGGTVAIIAGNNN